MPLPLIIPIAAAAAPLIAKGVEALGNRSAVKKQNAANLKLAEYQYSKDLEMWKMQNEYNSPASQMQRYSAAGLNPNLIYGTGTASAGNASASPKFDAPRVERTQMPDLSVNPFDIISQYQNIALQSAQIDNVKAQTASTQQKTLNDTIQNSILQSDLVPKQLRSDLMKSFPSMFQAGIEANEYAIPQQRLYSEQQRNLILEEAVKQAVEGTKQSTIKTEQMSEDLLFKKYENQLRQMGVTSSDHPVMRILVRMINELGINPFKY